MNNIKFIEIMVKTHPVEDTYYTSHRKHMFYTEKRYTHNELAEIMKNIKQKYFEDSDYNTTEIDMPDLQNQLAEFKIYELIPVERYYFDIEEGN